MLHYMTKRALGEDSAQNLSSEKIYCKNLSCVRQECTLLISDSRDRGRYICEFKANFAYIMTSRVV